MTVMAVWRMKRMTIAEWAHFQQLFGEFQLLYGRGDRDLALFVKQKPGAAPDEVYITGSDRGIIERLSPGGWGNSNAPAGEGLLLLVGTTESWTHLGISRET
jgi:hypothetical protein